MFKWIAVVAAVVVGIWSYNNYNNLVVADQGVQQSISQVQNILQRNAELIPNLANTVERYAKHESSTFTELAKNRTQTSPLANIDSATLAKDPELANKIATATASASAALVNFRSVQEAYPELKANKQFETLMTQLEGSINRVSVERRTVSKNIQDYNSKVMQLPTVIFAKLAGFTPYPYFKAADDAQTTPKIFVN